MSTKKAKPAGQYFCNTKEDAQDLLAKQNIIDLPGVSLPSKAAGIVCEPVFNFCICRWDTLSKIS